MQAEVSCTIVDGELLPRHQLRAATDPGTRAVLNLPSQSPSFGTLGPSACSACSSSGTFLPKSLALYPNVPLHGWACVLKERTASQPAPVESGREPWAGAVCLQTLSAGQCQHLG